MQNLGLTKGRLEANYKQIQKMVAQLTEAKYMVYLQCDKDKYFKKVDRNIFFPFLGEKKQ